MKTTISLIILLSFCSTSLAWWPFSKKEPKSQVIVTATTNTPPTISGGRELLKQLSTELTLAKKENQNLKVSLQKATEKLTKAEAKTIEVQKAADSLKEWGIIQQAEAQKFMEKYNNAVKRYHRLKAIAAVIAAAVGVLLGLQFAALIPPPYNLAVPLGGSALFASLVWFFL